MLTLRRWLRRSGAAFFAGACFSLGKAQSIQAQRPAEAAASPDTVTAPADPSAITQDTVVAPVSLARERPQLIGYTVDADAVIRWRLQQLIGRATAGFMLRSTSSMLEALHGSPPRMSFLRPATQVVFNPAMPTTGNNGPLWAGQGINDITTFGMRLAAGPIRLVLAPQAVLSSNTSLSNRDLSIWWSPPLPDDRVGREYALTWYQGRFSIDLPLRFGDGARAFVDMGQSSLYARTGPVEFGAATENNWWGPGIRNALVLSNAAPGFLHVFLRSSSPWATPAGAIEWRWIAGALEESDYFDTDPDNDIRSLAAVAVAMQSRFSSNLTLGAMRSVMANASGRGAALGRWFDVFTRTGRTEPPLSWNDPTTDGGREHIVALFGRYVMPAAGAELYGEWGRTALSSVRDILIAPNHTQGYTLGLQWSRPARREKSRLQVQAEVTTVEQSATFRHRPLGTWYASRRVVQGYTHRGEMLGAAIGPGASSQWLGIDHIAPGSSVGGYVGRTRWNEDIRSTYAWPDYMLYCNHDVSTYFGVRGSRLRDWGTLAADLGVETRINAYFQVASCFPPGRRDIRNVRLLLTFAPKL
jgi:hypothetical protein